MRLLIALMTATALIAPAWGQECPLIDAYYGQPGSDWTIRFHDIPPHALSNQTAAFTLTMPKSDVVLRGDVWLPNGYTQTWGALEGACEPKTKSGETPTPQCRLWEGVVYSTTANGIRVLSSNDEAPAPEQILLPQLASAIWYSSYRPEFIDADPIDVFTLAGCTR